jgi:hypothetical protein
VTRALDGLGRQFIELRFTSFDDLRQHRSVRCAPSPAMPSGSELGVIGSGLDFPHTEGRPGEERD